MDHLNIIECYGYQDNLLVLELGICSLRELCEEMSESERCFDLSTALSILIDVAKGVQYMHSLSLVHRDLTPSNLLICRPCTVKISDFGSGRILNNEEDLALTADKGTLKFSALETSLTQYNNKCDVYSFGMLISELCLRSYTDEIVPSISLTAANATLSQLLRWVALPEEELFIEKRKHYIGSRHVLQVLHWRTKARALVERHFPELHRLAFDTTHMDPDYRPTFCDILKILKRLATTSKPSSLLSLVEKFSENEFEHWEEGLIQ